MNNSQMKIPLSQPDITGKEIQYVTDVLKTPNLSLGPKLAEFEGKMAGYIGVKYAVAVNSGTSALHLILKSLDIKESDEVITTPFSFIASANSILFDNAKPVFVDIDPVTLNIDADHIKERITGKTKAVILIGNPVEHSMSPKMHTTAFKEVGINACINLS